MTLRRDDGARLAAWMTAAGLSRVLVVSPHLDDAVFSLAEFLVRDGLPSRRVLTVFTEAGPATGTAHARATGFSGPEEEFAARRREDAAAMARLGVAYEHLGLESGRLDEAAASDLSRIVIEMCSAGGALVLLPLGAGAELSAPRRLARRLLRRPPGCDVHADHVWVRDRLQEDLTRAGVPTGFYAEIPYQWANSPRDLARLAQGLVGPRVEPFALKPDVEAKLAAAGDYVSQIASEFGMRPSFRRRTAEIVERVYLPGAPPDRRRQGS
jgi:LmbE family N-acetylglucosaminyl deacetylase